MLLNFTKMHGIGNDYIYINCLNKGFEDYFKYIPKMCRRNFGIGSDGVILILPSKIADFKMRIINADGSEGEMCGNGIRCVGKYLYDKKITNKKFLKIETLAGIKILNLKIKDGIVKEVEVDMGEPKFEKNYNKLVFVDKKQIYLKCVSIGNPHAIVFFEDVNMVNIDKIGPSIESNKIFPNRTNVEFVQLLDQNNIKMRVWERGSGETLACGTGACASAVMCALEEYTQNNVNVHLKGGVLKINWNRETNHIFMTGPAEFVYEGKYVIN